VGPCLEALRDALKTVLGPESQSALARHYTHIADLVLSRWLAAEEILPSITRRHAEQARDQLETARALLRELDPQTAPPSETTLQELLRRLGEAMSRASGSQAARFQTLARSVISTEAAVRNEWETAIAAVAARLLSWDLIDAAGTLREICPATVGALEPNLFEKIYAAVAGFDDSPDEEETNSKN